MLEETELVKKLREIVWEADLCTTTAGIIRKKLEEHFGVDLSSKKQRRLINLHINCFLEEQLKTKAFNEEVRGEEGDQKEETTEVLKEEDYRKVDDLKEEEKGIANGMESCFQNLKAPSKGNESERRYREEEEEEEDATSKSKKAVEQPNKAREDEAPTKLKEREKRTNDRGKETLSQSKETIEQLIRAGEEEIPSKLKKSKREKQDDMQKSEKPKKKPKRTKVEELLFESKDTEMQHIQGEEASSKSKKPSKQPIQEEEEGVAPKRGGNRKAA